ncbi:hypothetical protein HK101_009533 [Irineochytrium annulatum]|nr:hypothetical protein HK101_009533 [Irineochytrium annulatum]
MGQGIQGPRTKADGAIGPSRFHDDKRGRTSGRLRSRERSLGEDNGRARRSSSEVEGDRCYGVLRRKEIRSDDEDAGNRRKRSRDTGRRKYDEEEDGEIKESSRERKRSRRQASTEDWPAEEGDGAVGNGNLEYQPSEQDWQLLPSGHYWRADANILYDPTTAAYLTFDSALQTWVPYDGSRPVSDATMKLVVVESGVVAAKGVVVIDGAGLTIGRDRADTRRLRLGELAVSRFHAEIFTMGFVDEDEAAEVDSADEWVTTKKRGRDRHKATKRRRDAEDGEEYVDKVEERKREGFFVVDHASTHGTFVNDDRISAAKNTSKPRRLNHLDRIRIGNSTFEVHLHDFWPCDACRSTGDNEIATTHPRGPAQQPAGAAAVPTLTFTVSSKKDTEAARVAELKRLRKQVNGGAARAASATWSSGSPSVGPSAAEAEPEAAVQAQPRRAKYVDRAAMRRGLNGGRLVDEDDVRAFRESTGILSSSALLDHIAGGLSASASLRAGSEPPVEGVGRSLLMKMGWKGKGLGSGEAGIVGPVVASGTDGRRGIGCGQEAGGAKTAEAGMSRQVKARMKARDRYDELTGESTFHYITRHERLQSNDLPPHLNDFSVPVPPAAMSIGLTPSSFAVDFDGDASMDFIPGGVDRLDRLDAMRMGSETEDLRQGLLSRYEADHDEGLNPNSLAAFEELRQGLLAASSGKAFLVPVSEMLSPPASLSTPVSLTPTRLAAAGVKQSGSPTHPIINLHRISTSRHGLGRISKNSTSPAPTSPTHHHHRHASPISIPAAPNPSPLTSPTTKGWRQSPPPFKTSFSSSSSSSESPVRRRRAVTVSGTVPTAAQLRRGAGLQQRIRNHHRGHSGGSTLASAGGEWILPTPPPQRAHTPDPLQPVDQLIPIHAEASAGNIDAVRALLDAGVDPTSTDSRGRTALHFAASAGRAAVLDVLLSRAAGSSIGGCAAAVPLVELPDSNGNTPLHLAVLANHLDCVLALMRAGADPRSVDRFKRTPVDLVESRIRLIAGRGVRSTVAGVERERLIAELRQIVGILQFYAQSQEKDAAAPADMCTLMEGDRRARSHSSPFVTSSSRVLDLQALTTKLAVLQTRQHLGEAEPDDMDSGARVDVGIDEDGGNDDGGDDGLDQVVDEIQALLDKLRM